MHSPVIKILFFLPQLWFSGTRILGQSAYQPTQKHLGAFSTKEKGYSVQYCLVLCYEHFSRAYSSFFSPCALLGLASRRERRVAFTKFKNSSNGGLYAEAYLACDGCRSGELRYNFDYLVTFKEHQTLHIWTFHFLPPSWKRAAMAKIERVCTGICRILSPLHR